MPRMVLSLVAVAVLTAATCSGERDGESVLAFFGKGKVGYGVDYGLYQRSQFELDRWDHVATVHGMTDDWELCTELKDLLAANRPTAVFDCRPLNQ